jgi:hypothetical protein
VPRELRGRGGGQAPFEAVEAAQLV